MNPADVLAQDRFNAARPKIEREPCLKPLATAVWTTAEAGIWQTHRWRDMGYGVFWLVGE